MNVIWVIAVNTFRQTVRQRLFYNVGVFGVGMVLLGMIMGNVTFGYVDRVVRSVGLSGVSIALDLISLLVAVGLVHQEIDRKSLFVVLTRPVRRWQYVTGRYFGLLAALSVTLVGLSLVFFLVLVMVHGTPRLSDLVALGACLPEAAVLGGMGLVLSCISTPLVASGMGLGLWMAAATTDDLMRLALRAPEWQRLLAKLIYYLLPALSRFNFREVAVYQDAVPWDQVLVAGAYGTLYATALVALAAWTLARREML